MESVRKGIVLGLIGILPGILLSACSTGQDSFSTEPGKGFGWKSMTETHKLIQREEGDMTPASLSPQPYLVASVDGVQRIPEQYLRIWIPPYQDAQGNLHEESAIQTVIQSGQWKVPNPTSDEHVMA